MGMCPKSIPLAYINSRLVWLYDLLIIGPQEVYICSHMFFIDRLLVDLISFAC